MPVYPAPINFRTEFLRCFVTSELGGERRKIVESYPTSSVFFFRGSRLGWLSLPFGPSRFCSSLRNLPTLLSRAFKMVDESSPVKVIQILLALPAGTVGTPSNYNANKPMEVAATVVAVPDYRNRRARGAVTYWQARGGGPNALRALTFPLDDESLAESLCPGRAPWNWPRPPTSLWLSYGLRPERRRQRDEECRA